MAATKNLSPRPPKNGWRTYPKTVKHDFDPQPNLSPRPPPPKKKAFAFSGALHREEDRGEEGADGHALDDPKGLLAREVHGADEGDPDLTLTCPKDLEIKG